MRVSASIELIWNLAAREAIAAHFPEIEPEHLLEALLKFAELPVEDRERLAPGPEVARILAGEVQKARSELTSRQIDSTDCRRRLRATLGKRDSTYEGGVVHRSTASKGVFDAAARLAAEQGKDVLSAEHLLEALLCSPTVAMKHVLGNAVGAGASRVTATPLLREYGRNLTQMAADGRLLGAPGRKAESTALVQALTDPQKRCVLLVGREQDARLLVEQVAQLVVSREAGPAMRGKRIIDLSTVRTAEKSTGEATELLVSLLAEAAKAEEVILWVPGIEDSAASEEAVEMLSVLKRALVKGTVHCICQVDLTTYGARIEKDAAWKRLAQVLWLHKERDEEIPREL